MAPTGLSAWRGAASGNGAEDVMCKFFGWQWSVAAGRIAEQGYGEPMPVQLTEIAGRGRDKARERVCRFGVNSTSR